jgi:hypothetical protein
MTDTASLFVAVDYRTLMGAFVQRKMSLGLTNLELDDRGGLAGGYTSKLFCGSKRLGLETLGKLLTALGAKVVVVPADAELALPKLTKKAFPIKDLSEEIKEKRREWGRKGGKKRHLLIMPRRRKAIAALAGRASAEARRLRKAGKIAQAKVADPAILRKLERRPVTRDKPSATAGPKSRLSR